MVVHCLDQVPTKGTEKAGAFDLKALEIIQKEEYYVRVKVGRFIIPDGYRPYTTSAYFEYEDFPYKVGDRICQCYLEKIEDTTFNKVDQEQFDLLTRNKTSRTGGFGSTGLK